MIRSGKFEDGIRELLGLGLGRSLKMGFYGWGLGTTMGLDLGFLIVSGVGDQVRFGILEKVGGGD